MVADGLGDLRYQFVCRLIRSGRERLDNLGRLFPCVGFVLVHDRNNARPGNRLRQE